MLVAYFGGRSIEKVAQILSGREPTMFENLGTIASLAALLAQIVILVASLTRTTEKAADAKQIALEAHEKIALLRSEFMLYREKVADEYINRDLLREFEERLTKAIDRVVERIDGMADSGGGAGDNAQWFR